MKYRVRYQDTADEDYEKIKSHYKEISPELAKSFLNAMRGQFELAKSFPKIGPLYSGNPNYRRMIISDFPYCAYYQINENDKTIDVVRILHTSRNVGQLIP